MAAAYLASPPVPRVVRVHYWCEGKQPFESAVLAQSVAEKSRRGPRQIYRCSTCGTFHIASASVGSLTKKAVRELVRFG